MTLLKKKSSTIFRCWIFLEMVKKEKRLNVTKKFENVEIIVGQKEKPVE